MASSCYPEYSKEYEEKSEDENLQIQKEAQGKGFDVSAIPLQDLFIYLTQEEVSI